MSIIFERRGNELLLIYMPDRFDSQNVIETLEQGENWHISRCFTVSMDNFRKEDVDSNEIIFCVGAVGSEYTYIDKNVLGTEHNFYFSNTIKLEKRHFVAHRNISILAKIDKLVKQDVYIGGEYAGSIFSEVYELLIKSFPKTAELDHYANSRISTILKEFFPSIEKYELKLKKYLEKQEKILTSSEMVETRSLYRDNARVEIEQFKNVRNCLIDLLSRDESVSEELWQKQIHDLLRFIYPKYIAGIREVVIKGVDRHDKRPDFLLIEANGYIDILEIKKPDVQLLTKQSSYRNNYVPVRELAGAIQQIEKYLYCLTAWGKEGEKELQNNLAGKLPASVVPKVVNPQGMLILGRSDKFNQQQRDDFELIKRQYKNIAEIMTYDDLLQRIDNIIVSLSREMEK